MHQRGVEVRPLREMTGSALFNEVFLTEARVPGGRADRRASTTAGRWRTRRSPTSAPVSAPVAAERSARRCPGRWRASSSGGPATSSDRPRPPTAESAADLRRFGSLIDLAAQDGRANDPVTRQRLVQLHVLGELGRLNGERMKSVRAAGQDIPGIPNISKLLMSDIVRLQRDLGLTSSAHRACSTPTTTSSARSSRQLAWTAVLGTVTALALYAQAPPIYGGTDQIQRNIIGERALGLPKEPNSDKDTPFSALPKNT